MCNSSHNESTPDVTTRTRTATLGPVGIAISVVISAVAAFNLLLDFDAIEQGVRARAPKYMEWYCGLSLLVTLVWLYLELLRLLSKLQRR